MVVYLEPNEEITSVVDHLIKAEEKEVVFIAPIGAQILQSLINLQLLKMEADNFNKEIIMVTQDEMGGRLAKKAGIKLSSSFDKDDFQNPYAILAASSRRKNQEIFDGKVAIRKIDRTIIEEEQNLTKMIDIVSDAGGHHSISHYRPALKQEEWKEPEKSISEKNELKYHDFKFKKWGFLIAGLIIIIGLAGILFDLPRAEIILTPVLNDANSIIQVKIDKGVSRVDLNSNVASGQLINMEKNLSRDFSATSERQINEKATGKLTIYNAYSSAPQTLVQSTRFLSDKGKIFRLPKTIIVPGAKVEEGKIIPSFIEADVVADEPGDSFNIGPSDFTIPGFQGTPKYSSFYAKSTETIKGGKVGKIKIVSENDANKAKEALSKELMNGVLAQAQKEIPSGFKLLDFALIKKAVSVTVTPDVGKEADKFTVNLKLSLTGMLFNENDIKKIVLKNIDSQLATSQEFVDKSLNLDYNKINVDFDAGLMNFMVSASGKSRQKIDSELLKSQLAGKNENDIRRIVSNLKGIASVEVKFWPFWVKKASNNLNKIKIID